MNLFEKCNNNDPVIVHRASGESYIGAFVGMINNGANGERLAVICTFDVLGRPTPHLCSPNGLLDGELSGQVHPI